LRILRKSNSKQRAYTPTVRPRRATYSPIPKETLLNFSLVLLSLLLPF